MINNKQQGFTLFEVLISMFIAGVAVLGLVMLELNILRSSQSSFNYTLATIEANTMVDRTWLNLCDIENAAPADKVSTYQINVYSPWKTDMEGYSNNGNAFVGQTLSVVSSGSPTFNNPTLVLDDSIIVYWNEKNVESYNHGINKGIGGSSDNKVVLNVTYPDFTGLCLP